MEWYGKMIKNKKAAKRSNINANNEKEKRTYSATSFLRYLDKLISKKVLAFSAITDYLPLDTYYRELCNLRG